MSVKRLKYEYRDNASKPHKTMGDFLRSHSWFKNFRILQEYPIPHTSYHVDWFIVDLKLAIEVHGEQHYKPVCFGGITKEEALQRYKEQCGRDLLKKNLCIQNGWRYIAFSSPQCKDGAYIEDQLIQLIS